AAERAAALAERLCAGMPEPVEPCSAVRDFAVALVQRNPDQTLSAARRLADAGLVLAAADGIGLALAVPTNERAKRRMHSLATALSAGIDAPLFHHGASSVLTPREVEVAQSAARR